MIEVESPTHKALFDEGTSRVAIYLKKSNNIAEWKGTGLWTGSKVVAYSSMKLDIGTPELERLEELLFDKWKPRVV